MKFRDFIEELKKDEKFKSEYERSKLLVDFARELILLRKSKGLTQEQLANLVGTKKSNISRIERGLQNLSVEMMVKIANALGAKLSISFKSENTVNLSDSAVKKLEQLSKKYGATPEEILNMLIQKEYEQLKHYEFGKLRDEFNNQWDIKDLGKLLNPTQRQSILGS